MPPIGQAVSLGLLAALFILGGVNHFRNPAFYLSMMPAYLPAHRVLVVVSGVCEVLGGIGLIPEATRRMAGFGLIALLVAMFPANLNMALHPEQFASVPRWALYVRLPIQAVLIAWVAWSTLRSAGS